VVATVSLVALGGACGSSHHVNPTAQARVDASRACVILIELSVQITENQSVLSTTADTSLARAETDAATAFRLDSHWSDLYGTVRAVRDGLLSGQRQTLGSDLDDLTVECEPFVTSSSPTTT
jgi:hypothetical protein